jgi:hypothetical protein
LVCRGKKNFELYWKNTPFYRYEKYTMHKREYYFFHKFGELASDPVKASHKYGFERAKKRALL